MIIRNIVHSELRRLITGEGAFAHQPTEAGKLRRIIAFVQDMEREQDLRAVPCWRAHKLKGRHGGTWSLLVNSNLRLTFQVDTGAMEIVDLDLKELN